MTRDSGDSLDGIGQFDIKRRRDERSGVVFPRTVENLLSRATLDQLDLMGISLPEVLAPGVPVAPLTDAVRAATGLPTGTLVVAGTTDSTAAVMAAGVTAPGDAVTCLGSTLVLKVLGERPVSAPELACSSGFWESKKSMRSCLRK